MQHAILCSAAQPLGPACCTALGADAVLCSKVLQLPFALLVFVRGIHESYRWSRGRKSGISQACAAVPEGACDRPVTSFCVVIVGCTTRL